MGMLVQQEERVVTVLVTGFGPFKSFTTNPSYLIAESLPEFLYPEPEVVAPAHLAGLAPTRPITTTAPVIRLIVHPEQIRVSYETVSKTAPKLIAKHDPDFIVHIGMAGGRDYYTLETLARRDAYRIQDVDDKDGLPEGESVWRKDGLPETLWTEWDEMDVLARWKGDVARMCRGDERAVVRLSRDAGRFLCEFILYTSLAYRLIEARTGDEKAQERRGKAAFLHVPGGQTRHLLHGVRISRKLPFVQLWEAGKQASEDLCPAESRGRCLAVDTGNLMLCASVWDVKVRWRGYLET